MMQYTPDIYALSNEKYTINFGWSNTRGWCVLVTRNHGCSSKCRRNGCPDDEVETEMDTKSNPEMRFLDIVIIGKTYGFNIEKHLYEMKVRMRRQKDRARRNRADNFIVIFWLSSIVALFIIGIYFQFK